MIDRDFEAMTSRQHSSFSGWQWWSYSAIVSGCVLLSIACYLSYRDGLHNEFMLDDIPAIVDNDSIRQLWPLVVDSPSGGPLNPREKSPLVARPLVNLSFAVNHHFSQLNPFAYRWLHLPLHVINALMVWALVSQTLSRPALVGMIGSDRGWL
ncbi:MAG: hypothetical protein AAGA03_18005, partial [Planctomycetota bacterium]